MGWASFGQGELVKGRVMFPRRKVAVWAYREGFLDEVRLESYWMAGWKRSLAWGREEKGLGPPWAVECPAPKRVSQNRPAGTGLLRHCVFGGKGYLGFFLP